MFKWFTKLKMDEWFYCCAATRKPEEPPPEKLMRQLETSSAAASYKKEAPHAIASPPALRMMNELSNFYDVDWSPKGELGHGHFAKVYRGRHKDSHIKVAAKRIVRSGSKTETLHNEIKALARLSHPNIVKLYDVFYDDVYVVLILEYLGGGELFGRIVKGGAYSERDAARHFRDLAGAISYMHSHGIVHRDLKPENLVLAEPRLDSAIKISDFGLSKILDAEPDGMVTVCGTRAYSAPEINFGGDPSKKGKRYTSKVDVWSMGVILYVILGAYHPFDPFGSYDNEEIWFRITHGKWDFKDKVWDGISAEAKDLLVSMICVNSEQRFSIKEVLNHPWLTQPDQLPTSNLSAVQNRQFRGKMGSDIDSQTNFSTQTGSLGRINPEENDDDMEEVKNDDLTMT
jgi:serine/threonine protein kinase